MRTLCLKPQWYADVMLIFKYLKGSHSGLMLQNSFEQGFFAELGYHQSLHRASIKRMLWSLIRSSAQKYRL